VVTPVIGFVVAVGMRFLVPASMELGRRVVGMARWSSAPSQHDADGDK
jgi:hypothetical protein